VTLDCLIKDPLVVDVLTGRIERQDVGTAAGRIAWVGQGRPRPGPETQVIDAEGSFLLPGLFDAHAHADLYFNPAAFSDAFIVRGVTSVFADNHDCSAALGPKAYERLLDASHSFNLRFFAGVPISAPPYPGVEGQEIYPFEDFARILARDDVAAVSEIFPWPAVLNGDRRLLERLDYARRLGKRAEGHTVGANKEKLALLAQAGITSCHEPLSPQDVQNRLDAGLWVMVRHSSIRTDMEEIIPYVKNLPREMKDRICLVTDGVFAQDYLQWGALDYTLTYAVKLGLDPIDALRMATINPARYFGLDHRLGQVRPGLAADLILVHDLNRPTPHLVLLDGRPAARDGRLLLPPSPYPDLGLGDRLFLLNKVGPEIFELHTAQSGRVRVPVIKVVNQTVTAAEELTLTARDGRLVVPDDPAVMKVALTARDGSALGLGLVKDLGFNIGGLASSVAHEAHGLLVYGTDPHDMAAALNLVLDMKGGLAAIEGGRELGRVPLPLGGIMSDQDLAGTARLMSGFLDLLRARGAPWPDPLLPMVFLPFTSILHLRITYSGVYDVRAGRVVFNGAAPGLKL